MSKELPKLGGIVTDNKDFVGTYKNKRENPHGLFSEQIFGPKQDYQCQCKKVVGNINDGEVCDVCGVLCGSSELRYTQFGYIQTPFPFVKPTKKSHLIKILGTHTKILLNPDRIEVNKDSPKYLALKSDRSEIQLVDKLYYKNGLVIPFQITGIYSLWIVLKFLSENLYVEKATEILEKNYITHTLKVLPPYLRMYTFDVEKNQLRNTPVSKLYNSIISMVKKKSSTLDNIKNDTEEWIEKIKIHLKDRIFDQAIIEYSIHNYDSEAYACQRSINHVYEYIYSTLSGKFGLIRNLILGRIIEFSGRAVITVDPSLEPYEIKVSKDILKTLWMPYFIHYLTTVKEYDYTYCFEKYLLHEIENEVEFNTLFDEFLEWFYS